MRAVQRNKRVSIVLLGSRHSQIVGCPSRDLKVTDDLISSFVLVGGLSL